MSEKDMLSFSEIKLTRSEQLCLERLDRGKVVVTGENEPDLKRLFRHGLAYPVWQQSKDLPRQAAILPRGKDYLAYLNASRTQKRGEWIRYIITTAIAVVALIVSIAAFIQSLSV